MCCKVVYGVVYSVTDFGVPFSNVRSTLLPFVMNVPLLRLAACRVKPTLKAWEPVTYVRAALAFCVSVRMLLYVGAPRNVRPVPVSVTDRFVPAVGTSLT